MESMTGEFPICRLNDSVSEAKRRAEKLGWDICPVVNEQGILLGLVRQDAWKSDGDASVETVMKPAPTTLRPSYSVDDATEFLRKQGSDALLITTSDGKLMGDFKRPKTAEQKQIRKSEIWA